MVKSNLDKSGKKTSKFFTLSNVLLLVISTFAFAYMIGQSFPSVSAATTYDYCFNTKRGGYSITWGVSSGGESITCASCSSQSQMTRAGFCKQYPSYCEQRESKTQVKSSIPKVSCPAAATGTEKLSVPDIAKLTNVVIPQPKVPAAATLPAAVNLKPGQVSTTGALAGCSQVNGIVTCPKVTSTTTQNQQTQQEDNIGGEAAGATVAGKFFSTTKFTGFKNAATRIIGNAGIALTIYFTGKSILKSIGVNPELADSLSAAAAAGYATYTIGVPTINTIFGAGTIGGPLGLGIAGGVALITFVVTYKKVRHDLATFSCLPWDAQAGGQNCEKCNKGDIPCTEYRCKSLGQACELDNVGTNEEICVWKNRGDVVPPLIKPWLDVLATGYKYSPDDAISPPDNGVKIVPETNATGCIAPFTSVRFGVTLNETAKCKISFTKERSYEDMSLYFGGSSTIKYNHSQIMRLPSPDSVEADNGTLANGGQFTVYTRCEDTNGNSNIGNFLFRFCVDKGPDTTPPVIESTSIINNMPISVNKTSVNLQIYLNEPAECHWSKTDQSYNSMENNMSCATQLSQMNSNGEYPCSTNLTGLKDRTDNEFYFRCKDQPFLEGTNKSSQRNMNPTSCIFADDPQQCKFTIRGTRPLSITETEPNGTIKDSTDTIKVTLRAETFAGANEGDATCSFSDTGKADSYIEFFSTGGNEHSQDLYLPEGDYNYSILCRDLGGNFDVKDAVFSVETDTQAPIVVRAFRESDKLKIVTNEEASCVYSDSAALGCTYLFEDGKPMTSLDGIRHEINWNPDKTLYIKCSDDFGNQPTQQCSIKVRPFELR